MSEWICEDVGLVIDEIRKKLEKELVSYLDIINRKNDIKFEGVVLGLNIASNIIEDVADNWTSENPPAEVLNKLKDKYK